MGNNCYKGKGKGNKRRSGIVDKETNALFKYSSASTFEEKNENMWESRLYIKGNYEANKKCKYYDNSSPLKFLFFGWVKKWIDFTSKENVKPYKLHALPVSDQILRWQPVFSKHVSDGLVRLESYQTLKSKGEKIGRNQYPYKSILLRALFLTFWKRTLFILVGIILTNILSISISILVKKLLKILNSKSFALIKIFLLLIGMIVLQLSDGLIIENLTFYMYRLIFMIQYSFSITTFQHGLCYRSLYSNNIEGSNSLGTCNKILHSCDSGSECTKNPLFCPALSHQDRNVAPDIFSFEYSDPFYVSMIMESLFYFINFLSKFLYGIFLISYQLKVNLWALYVIGFFCIVLMILIEILNTFVLRMIFHIRDYKITRCNEIIPSLNVIEKIFCDDIAMNIITESRNKELSLFLLRLLLTFFNRSMYIIYKNVSFFLLKYYFVRSINQASLITDIDTAGFLTTLYIFIQVIDSMFLLPHSFKRLTTAYVSFNRIGSYINSCSPNFYISDNRFTGPLELSSEVSEVTSDLDKDVVVLYKNATFAWVSSRNDLLNKNYQTFLEDVNFQIKRGEIAIVTGVLGSGKSNFIKSFLGEMTLVGGSMAVVPLYTSMPIFYASEDIWLQQGTIRSNITFGYRFDEKLYNDVLKSVELEYDISTWEKGDMRVVSDNALSLSGGQRVRMEMARALYAYLIFNQVNKQYNNSRCSFLMCLDSSFDGLDPFVSKTVFNNLFNAKSGIIVKDDLAVVLSSSKQSLDKCLSQSDLKQFPNIPVYQVKNKRLTFHCYIIDYFSGNLDSAKYQYFSKSTVLQNINYLTPELFDRCSSGSNKRLGRKLETISKYQHSFDSYIRDEYSGIKLNPYVIYITPSIVNFTIFIFLTFVLTIMDNVKFVVSTNLCDFISLKTNEYNSGDFVDLLKVKSYSNYNKNIILLFVIFIIILSLFSTLFFSIFCIISSRKIHEYSIKSIFTNFTTFDKITHVISRLITYLACDIYHIDEGVCYELNLSLVSLIETVIHLITLFYLLPLSTPFICFSLFVVFNWIFLKYINSSKNIQFSFLEALSNINNVCENAITGSTIYRSFKKEWELIHNIIEHTDYYMRYRLLNKSFVTWCSILFNWIFSFTTLLILIILIIFDKFTKYKLNVGYFGLGLTLSIKVIRSFTQFAFSYARMEMFMCSIIRIQYFIPPGVKCVFGKYINIHEEDLVVNPSHDVYKITKKQLLKRRSNEFNENNRRFNCFKRMFYKPKINIIDVTQYLPAEHKGLGLHSVFVHTSPDVQNEKGIILNNITASAYKSDIIGIIGRTGAGKTTLLSVLESTARNRTGKVLLDGMDLNDIPKNVTKHIIGVLPQLPFVFKGWTLRRFLDPRKLFSDEEINKALESCGLLEFVNDLQGGKKLDSILIPEDIVLKKSKTDLFKKSKKGSKSFESEKLTVDSLESSKSRCITNRLIRSLGFAKLVLYRYFYRIIIIDEPPEDANDETDVKGDNDFVKIYELLEKYFKHCTCFFTAHDASVLKSCTSVWVIHNGCLVKICKREEIPANESISSIIEGIVK